MKKDCFVMKLDQQGEIEWSRLYGGFDDEEAAACIEVDDGYIIAGDTNSVDADVNKQHKIVLFGFLNWIKRAKSLVMKP